jgi:hypothetical protein
MIIGGLKLIIQPNWPVDLVGEETYRSPAHPFIKWLSRWLPIDPWVEYKRPLYRERDPLIHDASGTVFCSAKQYDRLKREIAARNSDPIGV